MARYPGEPTTIYVQRIGTGSRSALRVRRVGVASTASFIFVLLFCTQALAEEVPLAAGEPSNASVRWIEAKVRALGAAARTEKGAQRAIVLAKLALTRAQKYAREGRGEAADRAKRIAWAAYLLASRRIARTQSLARWVATERRTSAAFAARTRAREALDASLQQRGLLLDEGRR